MIVVWPFLTKPRVCLQFVIVVFPDHTHYFCQRSINGALHCFQCVYLDGVQIALCLNDNG